MGGPIATAGDLVFVGAAMDSYFRAFDIETGRELWKYRLPAGGQATPMTYRAGRDQRQYVVIAAGARHARYAARGLCHCLRAARRAAPTGDQTRQTDDFRLRRLECCFLILSIADPGPADRSRHQDGPEPDLDLGAGAAVLSRSDRLHRRGDHSRRCFAAGPRNAPRAVSRKRWIRAPTCAATRTRRG